MTGIRLTNRTKTWINCIGLGVWISGAAWLLVHYSLNRQDALSISPAEPWSPKVHGAFAFLAVWSGGALIGGLLLLIVSGYFLYYALRMDVHQSSNYAAAREYFADTKSLKWDKNGMPVMRLMKQTAESSSRSLPTAATPSR
jgi:hypothetical protein